MPALAAALSSDALNGLPLPKFHSLEGQRLNARLESAFKRAAEYNRESLNRAQFPKKVDFNAVKPTKFVKLSMNYHFPGKAEVPIFPVEDD